MKYKFNKNILYKISLLIGIILVIYHLTLKMVVGYVAFSKVFFLIGILLLIYGVVELKYKVDIWGTIPKVFKKIIIVLFSIFLIIFISIEGVIIYNGHHYNKEKPDYVMVLGAGLRGSKLSLSLVDRLDTAIEFNRIYPDVKIIVSGGQGKGEDISEASAMKNYLVDNGVSEDLIICEDKSTNTYENFLFTKKLLEEETGSSDYSLMVISNSFHMYRAKFLGKKVGFKCLGYPAPSHPATTIIFHVREFFGVIKAYICKQ